jgi:hypothetical protein
MAALWGLALADLARRGNSRGSAGLLLVGLVLSHWVLDFISHAPDMPLWPGRSPRLGLGLGNSIAGTFVVEGARWLTGIILFLTAPLAWSRGRRLAFGSVVVVCMVAWSAGPASPPPPSPRALGWFALVGWIIVPWAALADRTAPAPRTHGP